MSEGHRPATYDDLLRVPDHLVAEIVDGELYTSPRPAAVLSPRTARLDRIRKLWWLPDEPVSP